MEYQEVREKVFKMPLNLSEDAVIRRLTKAGADENQTKAGLDHFRMRVTRKNDPPVKRVLTEEDKAAEKKFYSDMLKKQRAAFKALSPSEQEERKQQIADEKSWRKHEREEKARLKVMKSNWNREMKLLKFMLKSGVTYYHHSQEESLQKSIEKAIQKLKDRKAEGNYDVNDYHPYAWNYTEDQSSYLPVSQFERLWARSEAHPTIYDIPLDGTYVFYTNDSGERGLGSMDWMKAKKVEAKVEVPYVNPGGIPQITEHGYAN